MTYNFKKDHLTNWYAKEPNDKSTLNDDQDSYISERSSTLSLAENTPSLQSQSKSKKQLDNLQYNYNELPENGIPVADQLKQTKQEEEQRRKKYRKAPPGQGNLVPVPETKPPELGDNYYPYWYYYKLKNPDWIARHRQTSDGQLIPHESVDPSQYIHPPALSTSTKKSRKHHRKSHHDSNIMQYNPEQNGYEVVRKNSQPRSSSKQYIPLKVADNGEYSDQFNTEIKPQQREKLKTETDWNNHYLQSMTKSRSSLDSNNLNSNSNILKHRSKHHHHHRHRHHSKEMDNILPNENKSHHHSHHRHHHHHSPSQPQHHHLRYSPSKEYENIEFQVIDASVKKSEPTPYFKPIDNSLNSTPPAIYNQDSYLPPITRDYHYYKPITTDYYSTPTLNYNWKEPIKSAKIYKADQQTNFYDRYLNNVITKKLT